MNAPARTQALRMRPPASRSGSDTNTVLELRGLARLVVLAVGALVCAPWAFASSIHILFVGNSFTNGRYDPVRLYNASNVHDLNCLTIATCSAAELPPTPFPPPIPMLPLPTTNTLSEYGPYGGIPGIFKQFTVEAGLDYDVSLDTISAATLLGGFNDITEPNEQLTRQKRGLRTDARIEAAHDFFLPGDPRLSLPNVPPLHFNGLVGVEGHSSVRCSAIQGLTR